jgi:ribosomal protein S18 acetylase RimI-like enzyme
VTLVPFEIERLDELITMWRACFEFGVGVIDPNLIAEQRQAFLDRVLPNNVVHMAMQGETLVGFVAASPGSVDQLHVRVGFHRQGIGMQLLDWAKAQSMGSLSLYTFARNTGAQAFYEHNGFVILERGFESTWQLDDIKYAWSAADQ